MSNTENPAIAALLRAREDYVAQELPDQVAAADKRLASLGYKAPAKKAAPPAEKAPKGRTSRRGRQSTADSK